MPLVLRGRLAPHLVAAVIAAVLTGVFGFVAGAFLRAAGVRVPWQAIAVATGLLVLSWRYFAIYRRDGLALDDEGLHTLDGTIAVRWDEVRTLRLCAHPHPTGGRLALVRYAAVERAAGPPVAFCDKGPLARERIVTPHGPLADVAESGLVVALIAERLGLRELLPPPAAATAAAGPPAADPTAGMATVRTSYGLVPLIAKLGPKLAAALGKLWQVLATGAKTFKLGTAAVSLGAYSLLVSWQSAVALMVMIAWHEYGHVHAMRRCGIKVRGIYFIPFVGGAAVHEAPIADRGHQAYVALNGPLWGFYLTLVPLALFFLTGQRHPWLAVCAAMWATLNLFNLLPILPLDGGRALSAIAFSIHSSAGLAVAGLTLFLGLALTAMTRLWLLALVIGVGALEFANEIAVMQRRRALGALRCAVDLEFPHWHRLQSLARTVTQGQEAPRALAAEQAAYERTRIVLWGRALTPRGLVLCAGGYIVLGVALVGILVALKTIPGADVMHDVFR